MAGIMPNKGPRLVFLSPHQGAGVAQLVEQRFRKPQVARSIRVAGSTNVPQLQWKPLQKTHA